MADVEKIQKEPIFRFRIGHLPGTKRDYLLLVLVALDIFFLLFQSSYAKFLPSRSTQFVFLFDIAVFLLWGLNFLVRLSGQKNKIQYLRIHWYEPVGLIPIVFFRSFLLLRGVKLLIAFYKVGRARHEIRPEDLREVNFRFRDVIIDAVADAVFLQSLNRVEEVMRKLNYTKIAHKSFERNHDGLKNVVNSSLKSKSLIGEIAQLPFLSGIGDRMGDDVSDVIAEVLETEVMGDVMKEITIAILHEMRDRVKRLDVERITRGIGEEEENFSE